MNDFLKYAGRAAAATCGVVAVLIAITLILAMLDFLSVVTEGM